MQMTPEEICRHYGQATRTRAYNLVMALLAEDIAGRLELERMTEGGEADG